MILRPQAVDTSRFTFVREENMLVAEASDLPEMSRVWDDACDTGYTLVSHTTGNEYVYAVTHIETREGDLLYWDLTAAKASEDVGITVRIFND